MEFMKLGPEYLSPKLAVEQTPSDAVFVTDSNVHSAWSSLFPQDRTIVIPAGEASKNWDQVGAVLQELAARGLKRSGTLVAVGGGVIGDLAGFTAATYMRGIDLWQIPTSLLAMVDSAIGGKVGVDLPQGKNLAGAFWPAKRIIIGEQFLATLPLREWLCGSAEIWKYGAIMDEELFFRLEEEPISPGCLHLGATIRACALHKVKVVEDDPYEKTGLRATLNFGHTIGHAIEAALCYQSLTHGEAISIGMVLEARLGERIGFTESGCEERLRAGFLKQGLPVEMPKGIKSVELLRAMDRDKKATSQGLAFSLLVRMGECKLLNGVERAAIEALLAEECG